MNQETKDKVTNAIAHKDSNKSSNQLKEVTRELDIKKYIHFGGVNVMVYKGLYQKKEYQSIFAPLMDQLDQQLQQSQEAQKTPPRKQRSSLDHKKMQAKPMAKSNLNTPTELLSKTPTQRTETEDIDTYTDTGTVQTNPTSLGGNTHRSNNIGESQTDLDAPDH